MILFDTSDHVLVDGDYQTISELVEKNKHDLKNADLQIADLHGVNLRTANLAGADLSKADLAGTDLSMADLRDTNFDGADLYGTKFCGAKLEGAKFDGQHIVDAQRFAARLIGAYIDNEHLLRQPIFIHGLLWPVLITDNFMRIGCQRWEHQEWRDFSDRDIHDMDTINAVKFWSRYKKFLLDLCREHKMTTTWPR